MKLIFNKYSSLSTHTKAALWFVACSFLQKGISFITVPIFTRLLSTEQYGTYTVYLSWLQVMTIFTSLYMYNGVFDNAMAKFKEDRDRYISAMQGLTIVIWAVVLVIFFALYPFLNSFIGLAPIFLVLMFIEMFFTPATNYWMGRQRFEYSYKRLVFFTLLKSLLNPVLGIVLVLMGDQRDLLRIISIVAVEALFGGVVWFFQFSKGRSFYDKEYWQYGIKLAIPMLPHYLAGMVLNQGDRIMIDRMVGRSEVGLYGVAYSVGMLVQIFVAAVNSAITPWLYQRIQNKEFDEMKKTATGLIVLIAGVAVFLMLISPEAILLFGSSKYSEAVYVIPPVAASVYFIFLYSILSFPQFYYEKTSFLMVASLFAAAANVVLNYIFIRQFGYIAAGYTTLACYVLYALGHFLVSRRVLKQENAAATSIVDNKATLVVSILLIVFTIFINFVLQARLVRYGIMLCILLAAYYKRTFIIDHMKKMVSSKIQ